MPDTPLPDVLEREFALDLQMALTALSMGETTADEAFTDIAQLVRDELADTIERLSAELERVLPKNVCLTNANVPDSTIVPLDFTMGELRRIRAALTASPQAATEPQAR